MCLTQPSSTSTRTCETGEVTSRRGPRLEPKEILQHGCTLVAFLSPLKLAWTHAVLVPLILLWLYTERPFLKKNLLPKNAARIAAPFSFFLLAVTVSAATGLSPSHSVSALVSLLFFTLTAPLFCSFAQPRSVITALIAGQSIAAFHSLAESALPFPIPRLFLGEVTESGQLALTVLALVGLCWGTATQQTANNSTMHSTSPDSARTVYMLGALMTALVTLVAFQGWLAIPAGESALLYGAVVVASLLIGQAIRASRGYARDLLLLVCIEAPLLLCALMINLKRGPWLGVIVGASLFFTFYAKRFVWIIVVLSAAVAVGVQPIYDRIASSYNHFTISGGRSTIWRIGAELATEYPLGVGYHNSGILRQFSTEIPRELKHFHNNLLNIVTENGWLAGLLFAWFLVEVCRASFRKPRDPIYIAIGCAVISWQIAGLVEYNFGDSEVMVIVWMLLGLLLQRESNAKPSRASEPASVSSPN